ncbi:TPA: alcohol dehydrogenase [Candidatus Sumerlaeota bacterium]|jgi:threonine dehydrogenase-like Zn-dependent dehydrogenase|nr:alcohol dehydrogenase [Candidatus Sumerlaeota bacterium]
MAKMTGAILPGNSTVEFREYNVPEPGERQVLVRMKASTICGSDIRAIYREHLGKGPEGYQGVICGHEPAGQIVKTGKNCRRFKEGERVVLYHISGCGVCHDCRMGYQISCSAPQRAAYGWQRDGGMAEYCLAEEADCVLLPDFLSYIDGACCACGFGTCYEAIRRINVNGDDIALVVGLGPMGLAALMLAKARGASKLIAADIVPERMELVKKLGLADVIIKSDAGALDAIRAATNGRGCEAVIDCSGNTYGRQLAVRGTRQWGRCVFVGEGGTVELNPSPDMIHDQKTLFGSWVTSLGNLEDLVERLPRWNMHPDMTCTHKFSLENVGDAFKLMDEGKCGKVAVVWE